MLPRVAMGLSPLFGAITARRRAGFQDFRGEIFAENRLDSWGRFGRKSSVDRIEVFHR
jgi:hypothetical protein